MRVVLGNFARSGIERHLGADLAAGVQAALLHYSRRLRSARAPVWAPRACDGFVPDTPGASIDLPVDPEVRLALEREAERWEATTEQMLAHAVLVYLADMDAAAAPAVPPCA
jgi:hypothetical protein